MVTKINFDIYLLNFDLLLLLKIEQKVGVNRMKDLYVSESTVKRIKAFNEAKERGVHIPYVRSTFMSIGTRSIFFCPVQKRVITLLGKGEKHLYITKLFEPNVVEIKEQYPLDYVRTQEIADTHGVIHPRKHLTGELTVLTTDLLVTYREKSGAQYRVAYSFKHSIDARSKTRTMQKFDIETAYWKRFGVRAEQVLRDDVSKIKADNLLNYINHYNPELSDSELRKFASALLDDVIEHPCSSLRESLKAVSSSLKVKPSHCMTLFANSMFKHVLPIDLTQKIKLHKPLNLCPVFE